MLSRDQSNINNVDPPRHVANPDVTLSHCLSYCGVHSCPAVIYSWTQLGHHSHVKDDGHVIIVNYKSGPRCCPAGGLVLGTAEVLMG